MTSRRNGYASRQHYRLLPILCVLLVKSAFSNVNQSNGNNPVTQRPNIVILMSDDQDLMLGSMDVMHYTRDRVISQGATFGNAFTTSPICCPSRSSFLTGRYSHNHNVLTNNENCSSTQWKQTHETRTFATYLNRSGYATGYFGKYLNEYDGSYTPPGWQYWMGLLKNTKYYNYTLRHNDRKEQHRDSYEKDYLTDLIVNRSMVYFQRGKLERPDTPILAFLSFPAPHGSEDGAPQYQNLYANVTSHRTQSYGHTPNPNKHWIVSQVKQPMDETQHRFSTILQQKRLQTLRSLDDGVEKFVQMLDSIGELDNTYILYTSDHGFHIGQFGLAKGKSMPYDFDIRVPFYLRGPGIPAGLRINDIVLNIDIAPTILGIAGVAVPEWMDGRNFMPLINSRSSIDPPWRDSFLVERGKIPHSKMHMAKPRIPSKQQKVEQACQQPQFTHPCEPDQLWTCAPDPETGVIKMRKCNKFKKSVVKTPKKKKICTCPKKSTAGRLSPKCRRRVQQAVRGRTHVAKRGVGGLDTEEFQEFIRAYAASDQPDFTSNYEEHSRTRRRAQQNSRNGAKSFKNRKEFSSNPYRRMLAKILKMRKGSQSRKQESWRKRIQTLKVRIRIMEALRSCPRVRSKKREKCKCQTKVKVPAVNPNPRVRQSSGNESIHPMKLIVQEIREEYDRRLQDFKVLRTQRKENADVRQQKKVKMARRTQHGPGGRCSEHAGVNCFRLSRDRWVTQPVWDGEERCYCTNSNNNTYWCIRVINETSNLLYCEFITGFIEYYDLRTDPHQLSNTFTELSSETHTALNAELAQLRVCRGATDCHVTRPGQLAAVTPTSVQESVGTEIASPSPEVIVGRVEPEMQTSTIATTTNHIPTNYPPGSNQQQRNGRNRRRKPRPNGNGVVVKPRSPKRRRKPSKICDPRWKRRSYHRRKRMCRASQRSGRNPFTRG